ncbi:MAG: hypothetical protein ACUVTD_04780 [Nitrososphaerales archaeon]
MDDIEDSMKLRLELKNKGFNLSYADALGYYLAGKLGIRFLTGDRVFKELANVEFRVWRKNALMVKRLYIKMDSFN